ncbi:MAG TPA: hypothetical protein VL651_09080 [Bacteroidia bacterium]|jgi:hypothetical protein|nr:hypothetical protein [Bacteroidia bacterium]
MKNILPFLFLIIPFTSHSQIFSTTVNGIETHDGILFSSELIYTQQLFTPSVLDKNKKTGVHVNITDSSLYAATGKNEYRESMDYSFNANGNILNGKYSFYAGGINFEETSVYTYINPNAFFTRYDDNRASFPDHFTADAANSYLIRTDSMGRMISMKQWGDKENAVVKTIADTSEKPLSTTSTHYSPDRFADHVSYCVSPDGKDICNELTAAVRTRMGDTLYISQNVKITGFDNVPSHDPGTNMIIFDKAGNMIYSATISGKDTSMVQKWKYDASGNLIFYSWEMNTIVYSYQIIRDANELPSRVIYLKSGNRPVVFDFTWK